MVNRSFLHQIESNKSQNTPKAMHKHNQASSRHKIQQKKRIKQKHVRISGKFVNKERIIQQKPSWVWIKLTWIGKIDEISFDLQQVWANSVENWARTRRSKFWANAKKQNSSSGKWRRKGGYLKNPTLSPNDKFVAWRQSLSPSDKQKKRRQAVPASAGAATEYRAP